MLADRHQLMEAYLIAGSIFPSNVQVDEADEFHIYIYNTCIQAAVRMYMFGKTEMILIHLSNLLFVVKV